MINPLELKFHLSIETGEPFAKYIGADAGGEAIKNASVKISRITLEPFPQKYLPSTSDEHAPYFRIVSPESPESMSMEDISELMGILCNDSPSDIAQTRLSINDSIVLVYSIKANAQNGPDIPIFPHTLFQLAGYTIKLFAYNGYYSYKFPNMENMSAWTPILTTGIITFTLDT